MMWKSALYFGFVFYPLFYVEVIDAQSETTTERSVATVCKGDIKEPQKTLKNSLKPYEVDVVFVLDRSQSVHDLFNRSKDLIYKLLTRYYIVHPEFARVHIVSFANTALVEVNPSYETVVSCLQQDIVRRLKRIDISEEENVSGISKALDKAEELLKASEKKVHKVIWLFSDGMEKSHNSELYNSSAKRLKEKGEQIFAVGQKAPNKGWMEAKDELNLKEIASTTGHYACLDQWFRITELVPSIMPDAKELGNRIYFPINDEGRDTSDTSSEEGDTNSYPERLEEPECLCYHSNQGCYCNALEGREMCTCKPGFYLVKYTCTACPEGTSKSLPGPAPCVPTTKDTDEPTTKDTDEPTLVIFGAQVTIKLFSAILAGCLCFLILLIVVAITACCIQRRRKEYRQSSTESNNVNDNVSDDVSEYINTTVIVPTNKKKRRRPPPSPPEAPPPPSQPPPDYEDAIYGDVDLNNPALYAGESLQKDMPGWPQFMIDGIKNRCTSGMCISTFDTKQWARTPGFKLKDKEIKFIAKILKKVHEDTNRPSSTYVNTEIYVQSKKYLLKDNNGVLLNAVGPVRGRSENVLWAAISKEYVIVAKAPKDSDRGQCKAEVLRILQHLQAEERPTN